MFASAATPGSKKGTGEGWARLLMRFIYITILSVVLAFLVLTVVAVPDDVAVESIASQEVNIKSEKTTKIIRCGAPVITQRSFRWYAGRVYRRNKISQPALNRLDAMRACSLNATANRNMLNFQKNRSKRRIARLLAQRVFPVRPHLQRIAQCESGGNPRAISPGGAYRGKYQFSISTWNSVGGRGDPAQATEYEQDRRAEILYKTGGPGHWPVCQHR